MRPYFLLVALLFAFGCATPPQTGSARRAASAPLDCAMAAEDLDWIDRSVDAWRDVSRRRLRLPGEADPTAIFFDRRCVLTGAGVMSGASAKGEWRSAPHDGDIPLPDGSRAPATILSFAAPYDDGQSVFFTMSAPSIWKAERVDSPLGLETLMTGVLVHEMTHTAQFGSFGARIDALAARWGFGDDLNDDVVQKRFRDNPEYSAAVEKEISLLYAAAAAPGESEARALAREAKAAIDARRARWLVGDDERFLELEDIFLSMEGTGNWAAVAWLTDSAGPGVNLDAAVSEFGRRGGRWSQNEGTAIYLVIDRLTEGWQARAFGDEALTAFELLAIAAQ